MTATDDLITSIILEEGPPSANPLDAGGRTAFGISERANPQAWQHGAPTEEAARAIYMQKYVLGPHFDLLPLPLQTQMVDYGVNSGPYIATSKLQAILRVPIDGKVGPATLAALAQTDGRIVNNALVAARVRMIGNLVHTKPSQVTFLNGWLDRALQFLV